MKHTIIGATVVQCVVINHTFAWELAQRQAQYENSCVHTWVLPGQLFSLSLWVSTSSTDTFCSIKMQIISGTFMPSCIVLNWRHSCKNRRCFRHPQFEAQNQCTKCFLPIENNWKRHLSLQKNTAVVFTACSSHIVSIVAC